MNSDLLLYLLFGTLAAFRLSLMVSKEDGPYWIFAKIRRLPPAKSSTKQGLSCQWCVSVYASALVCYGYWLADLTLPWPIWLVLWLAISSGAICVNQTFTKGPA